MYLRITYDTCSDIIYYDFFYSGHFAVCLQFDFSHFNFQGVEINDLANICASTVLLLSSTLDGMRPLLWVTLLKLLTDPTYDHAVCVITKALAQIAHKQEPETGEVFLFFYFFGFSFALYAVVHLGGTVTPHIGT